MLFKPTEGEITRAQELDIETKGKSGPTLREAIKRAEANVASRQRLYQIYIERCTMLGLQLPKGQGLEALRRIINVYEPRLLQVLQERGIVEDATLTIPASAKELPGHGKARVGKLMPRRGFHDKIMMILMFDTIKNRIVDPWYVWKYATDIEPPSTMV